MTLDELNTVFDFAVSRSIQTNREDLPPWAHRRAGLKAVVEALRDDATSRANTMMWDGRDFEDFFDEILASDGTHGSPELDEDARKLEALGQDAGPTVQDLFPEAFASDGVKAPAIRAAAGEKS